MLSSKIVSSHDCGYNATPRSLQGQIPRTRRFVTTAKDDEIFGTTSQAEHEQGVEITGGAGADSDGRYGLSGRTSSQECIIRGEPSFGMASSVIELEPVEPAPVHPAGISKTVEFEVQVSQSRMGNRSPPS